jgi:hypothetical protein
MRAHIHACYLVGCGEGTREKGTSTLHTPSAAAASAGVFPLLEYRGRRWAQIHLTSATCAVGCVLGSRH